MSLTPEQDSSVKTMEALLQLEDQYVKFRRTYSEPMTYAKVMPRELFGSTFDGAWVAPERTESSPYPDLLKITNEDFTEQKLIMFVVPLSEVRFKIF